MHAGFTSPIDSYAACIEAGNPVLQTNPPICRDGPHNFTGTALPPDPPSAAVTSVPFEILVDGDTRTQIPAHHQDFINTPGEWQAFWLSVHAGLATPPPLIPVDFAQSSVVGVSLGAQLTSGYGLKITNVTNGPTGSVISLTESTPTIMCPVVTRVSNRYVIIRTAKLTGPVSFRITSEKRHCP